MAIYEIQQNGKTVWGARVSMRIFKGPGGKPQLEKRNLKSRDDAMRVEKELRRKLVIAAAEAKAAGLRWHSVLDEWEIAGRNDRLDVSISLQTVRDYRGLLNRITAGWKSRPIKEITRHDCIQIFRQMREQEGLSLSRVKNAKNALSGVFKFAIDRGWIPSGVNPVCGYKIKRDKNTMEREILTVEEQRKLLLNAKLVRHPWYPVWAFALLTGMRSGELYALRFSDIDLDNLTISVTKAYNAKAKRDMAPKGRDWRVIPINDDLRCIISELRLSSGRREHVFPRLPEWERGEQAKVLRAFCSSIGIPNVRFHTLRACFATTLLRMGVDSTRLMKIGGWKDLKTVMEYIRLAGVDIRGATSELSLLPSARMGEVIGLFETKAMTHG